MAKQIEISSATGETPVFMQRPRVAAYCRVSTEQEEQRSSLETQELYYSQIISRNPFWTEYSGYANGFAGTAHRWN